MSTFTIELPDTVMRQIQSKGISQQQLESVFIRVIQLYLDETLPTTMSTDVNLPQPTKTLLDIRGSIPVSAPQDFDAIRQQVISTHIRQRMPNGK
jgi:hypothetical protein